MNINDQLTVYQFNQIMAELNWYKDEKHKHDNSCLEYVEHNYSTGENIYKIKFLENLFLKVEYHYDSYGGSDYIRSLKIVKGKIKTVVEYE